jgi:hypothetical protein
MTQEQWVEVRRVALESAKWILRDSPAVTTEMLLVEAEKILKFLV